jgi:hypothetical protein
MTHTQSPLNPPAQPPRHTGAHRGGSHPPPARTARHSRDSAAGHAVQADRLARAGSYKANMRSAHRDRHTASPATQHTRARVAPALHPPTQCAPSRDTLAELSTPRGL